MASPLFGQKAKGSTPLFSSGVSTPTSHHRSGGGFLSNLIGDVRDTLVGLPAGLVMTAEHPIRSLEQMGTTTWHDWSPLFHGDLNTFGKQFYDHPLGPILDVAAVFSGGAGAVGKAAKFATKVEYRSALAAAEGSIAPEVVAAKNLSKTAKLGRHQYIEIPSPPHLGGRPHFKELSANPFTRQFEVGTHKLGLALSEYVPNFFSRFSMEGHYMRLEAKQRSMRAATTGAIRRSVTSEIAGLAEQRIKREGKPWEAAVAEHPVIDIPKAPPGTVATFDATTGEFLGHQEKWLAQELARSSGREPFSGLHQVSGFDMGRVADTLYRDENRLVTLNADEAKALRAQTAAAARGQQINTFMEAGKFLHEDPRQMYRVVEGTLYMNALRTAEKMGREHLLDGTKPPVGWKFMVSEARRTPWEAATPEGVINGMETWAKRNTTKDLTKAAKDEYGHYLMVRDGEMSALGQEAANATKTLRHLWETPTNIWKWSVLATRPAFFVNNTVGNVLMANAALGPAEFARNMITAIRNAHGVTKDIQRSMSLDRRTARAIRHTIGDPNDVIDQLFMGPHRLGFGQEQLMGSPTWLSKRLKKNGAPRSVWKGARTIEQGFLPVTHRVAESWVRRVLLESYLRKSEVVRSYMTNGQGFEDAVRRAAGSPNFRAQIEKKVANALGDYHHFNPLERKIRAIVPFYSWDRAIMRHTMHLAKDRPFTAAFLATEGDMGTEETKRLLGDIPTFMKGYLPLSLLGIHGKGGRIATMSTQGVNPYATVPDVVETAAALVSHPKNVKLGSVLASQVNPLATGAFEQATGQSLLSGARKPEATFPFTHHGAGVIGGSLIATAEATPPLTFIKDLVEGGHGPKRNKRTGELKPFLTNPQKGDLRHFLESWVGVPVKNISPQAAEAMARQESGRKKRKKAKKAARGLF